MNFFSKNKKDDYFYLVEESEAKENGTQLENPNVLTVQELLNRHEHRTKNVKNTGALDSLKKRMLHPETHEDAPKSFQSDTLSGAKTFVPTVKADDKVADAPKETEEPQQQKTLLEKCKPFILDESGQDTSRNIPPSYKLDSVADILRKDKDDTIDGFNQKYDFEADYLGKYVEKQLAAEKEIKQEKNQSEEKPKPIKTITTDTIPITSIKNAQTNVSFTISDIDIPTPTEKTFIEEKPSDATITFTPVNNSQDGPKMFVSSKTQQLDLTGEMAIIEDISSHSNAAHIQLEKDEFEEYIPQNEVKSEIDSKRFLRVYSIKKRNYFLISTVSIIAVLILLIMKMPFMTGVILTNTSAAMVFCTIISGFAVIANADMFKALKNIFTKKSDADVCASLCSLFVTTYAIFGIVKSEVVTDLLLLLSIILALRAIGKFQKYSYLLSNLKQISIKSPKKAVRLLSDPAITHSIAKNSIEGDILIAATQECEQIYDYIKYSTFGTFLNGKLPIITIISLVLSVITFFATSKYFEGTIYGLYAACAVQCFAALPGIFLIDNLPIYAASKKLNKKGAMISGKAGAEHIELTNAVVLNSDDLFPSGTVTLHKMQVLSENDLTTTLLRAASLTQALSSPLAPIFREIVGEENMHSLPVSDTVKYEELMGISGWVDNQLLFIGNRTIMEAHGIYVPNIETDRKILRSGYFPVYVASDDTAVALLMIQYSVNPSVAKELRHLTQIGVTLLINSTDPNLTEEMICDYLGLYDDSVMVMTAAGNHMYKNTTEAVEFCSCPASYRGKPISLAYIINCANRIRKSNTLLTVMYILSAVLGIIIFAYSSFASSNTLINSLTVLLYAVISTAITFGLYLTQKP